MDGERWMASDEQVNDEQRADKRLSDRWLREEEKKSGRRLRIRICILSLTSRTLPTLPVIFRAEKLLTKNWHCRTLVALWIFLAYLLAL
jgi:hypothetical protein